MRTRTTGTLPLLLLTACGGWQEPLPPIDTSVVVTPTHYEFLGQKYTDLKDLIAALDTHQDVEVGFSIDEVQGCVSAERSSEVLDLLKSRPNANLAFVGHSSSDACTR